MINQTDKNDMLAYLYTKSQDLAGKTPEEILLIFNDAYERIVSKQNELINDKKANQKPFFPG